VKRAILKRDEDNKFNIFAEGTGLKEIMSIEGVCFQKC